MVCYQRKRNYLIYWFTDACIHSNATSRRSVTYINIRHAVFIITVCNPLPISLIKQLTQFLCHHCRKSSSWKKQNEWRYICRTCENTKHPSLHRMWKWMEVFAGLRNHIKVRCSICPVWVSWRVRHHVLKEGPRAETSLGVIADKYMRSEHLK